MKPHLTCHMVSSVDGRIPIDRWRPEGFDGSNLYETLHDKLDGQAWIVGRRTGEEFAKDRTYPDTDERYPREAHIVRRDADGYAIVIDAHGKIAFGQGDIDGEPIVTVLSRSVSDRHLAGLRADGVSYIFAGDDQLDLADALDQLNALLGLERIILEGGGGMNGAFLRAGLVDALSLAICPVVDGAGGSTSVFDGDGDRPPLAEMTLTSCETLDAGAVWLRYDIRNR